MVKKTISLFLCISLIISFTGCGETKEGRIKIEDFISRYANEEYNVSDGSEYNILYSIEMKDADFTEEMDLYKFTLFSSLYEDTSRMMVFVDEDKYINCIIVQLRSSVLNLFKSSNEIGLYFVSILTSLNCGLSKYSACDNVDKLWNQVGDKRELEINENLQLNLEIFDDFVNFIVTFR